MERQWLLTICLKTSCVDSCCVSFHFKWLIGLLCHFWHFLVHELTALATLLWLDLWIMEEAQDIFTGSSYWWGHSLTTEYQSCWNEARLGLVSALIGNLLGSLSPWNKNDMVSVYFIWLDLWISSSLSKVMYIKDCES